MCNGAFGVPQHSALCVVMLLLKSQLRGDWQLIITNYGNLVEGDSQ